MIAKALILGTITDQNTFDLFLERAKNKSKRERKAIVYIIPSKDYAVNKAYGIAKNNITNKNYHFVEDLISLKPLLKEPNVCFVPALYANIDEYLQEVKIIISQTVRCV